MQIRALECCSVWGEWAVHCRPVSPLLRKDAREAAGGAQNRRQGSVPSEGRPYRLWKPGLSPPVPAVHRHVSRRAGGYRQRGRRRGEDEDGGIWREPGGRGRLGGLFVPL